MITQPELPRSDDGPRLSVGGLLDLQDVLRVAVINATARKHASPEYQRSVHWELSSQEKRTLWVAEDEEHEAKMWLTWANDRIREKETQWKKRLEGSWPSREADKKAAEVVAAAKPNRTPPYIGMPKSDEE